MKKTNLSEPRKIIKKGLPFWEVTAPGPGGIGRVRRIFKDKVDAVTFYNNSKVQIARFGTQAMELSDRLRVQAIEGAKALDPFGASLADAVAHYVQYLTSKQGGVPLSRVVKELIEEKTEQDRSDRYRADLRLRLGRFVKAFPKKSTRDISKDDIASFLSGLGVASGTRRTYRRDIRTMFKFAIHKDYAEKNPTDDERKTKKEARAKIEILTVGKTLQLLNACDKSILPAVAIAAFCGLRMAELSKLQWEAIDIEEKVITVDAAIAKTKSRRVVSIPDNAVKWITPHVKDKGAVMPDTFRGLFDHARVRAGFKPSFEGRPDVVLQKLLTAAEEKEITLTPWPANCLRHGAISYRLAESGDIGKTATAAGNSPAIIAEHYLQLVKPSAAKAFFELSPSSKKGKILTFTGKAA